MQSKEDIESLIRETFARLGGNHGEIHIKPQDGFWGTALTYKVTRSDGVETVVFRRHIDDKRYDQIEAALKFLLHPKK